MAILSGDIKLVASQVMDDVAEGGGAPTPVLVLDGTSNAIFPDISELDRAGGRINLRKLFVSVQTANRDTYMGSNIIVAEPPNDPNVSVTIFSNRDVFDRRDQASNKVESYLIQGPRWPGFLYTNHVAGQRSITLFQKPGTSLPTVGRTLVLIQNAGLVNEQIQYVRGTKVEYTVQMFVDSDGKEYAAWVVVLDISDALRANFGGSEAIKSFTPTLGKTFVHDTTAADAGSYFGVAPLGVAAAIGDATAKATTVYTQLVPSARTESVALDQVPAAQRTLTLATTPRLIEVAAAPHTASIKVGQENRSYNWVNILKPRPAPNGLVVSFRALGQWYTLEDDGAGTLSGSGTGTVNYLTGSISVTLPVLPDVGSSLIFAWGENTGYTDHSGQASYRAPEYTFVLEQQGIKPGSVSVTWLSGGVTKTATDNSAGALTGHATGEVNYAAGKLHITPTAMIDSGGEFQIDYQYTNTVTKTVAATTDAGGFATITLDDVPAAGSVHVKWITVRSVSASSGAAAGEMGSGSGVKNRVAVYPPPPPPSPPRPFQPNLLMASSSTAATVGGAYVTLEMRFGGGGTLASPYVFTLPAGLFFSGATRGANTVSGVAYSVTETTFTLAAATVMPLPAWIIALHVEASVAGSYTLASPAVNLVTEVGSPLSATSLGLQWFVGAPVEAPLPPVLSAVYQTAGVSAINGDTFNASLVVSNPKASSQTLTVAGITSIGLPSGALSAANGGVLSVSAWLASAGITYTGTLVGIPLGTVFPPGDSVIQLSVQATRVGTENMVINPGFLSTAEGYNTNSSVVVMQITAAPALPGTTTTAPPAPAIASREPINTGQARDPSGGYYTKGRYLGGVTAAGADVFVAVSVSYNLLTGNYFDPPASATAVWLAVDLATKQKTLQSVNGVTTTYLIWETAA